MNLEIERKFLIKKEHLPKLDILHVEKRHYHQGYLCLDPVTRVILGRNHALLSVKGPGMLSRMEFEYQIPLKDAEQLLKLCKFSLQKTRYILYSGGKSWEIDQFHGPLEGFWLAEIELSSETEEFEKPVWAGEEVTENKQYYNANLAQLIAPPLE